MWYFGEGWVIGLDGQHGLDRLKMANSVTLISPLMIIKPILPLHPMLLLPLLSCSIHLFPDASLLQETLFLPLYQPFDEHITLMNQRNGKVSYHLIRTRFNFLSINSRIQIPSTKRSRLNTPTVIISPLLQSTHP